VQKASREAEINFTRS